MFTILFFLSFYLPFLDDNTQHSHSLINKRIRLQQERIPNRQNIIKTQITLNSRDRVIKSNDRNTRMQSAFIHIVHLHFFQDGAHFICQIQHLLHLDGRIHQTEIHVTAVCAKSIVTTAVDVDGRVFESFVLVEPLREAIDEILSRDKFNNKFNNKLNKF